MSNRKRRQEEISQFEKDDLEKKRKELEGFESARKELLETYGSNNKIVKQLDRPCIACQQYAQR